MTRPTRYVANLDDDQLPPDGFLVNALVVERRGGHDYVRVYNRGALAGELIMVAGDGELMAWVHGLLET
jgi:hypothetical protein